MMNRAPVLRMVDDLVEIEWPGGGPGLFICTPEFLVELVTLINDALRVSYDLAGGRPSTSPGNWRPCTRGSTRGLDR